MITGKAVTIREPGGPEVLAIQPFEVRDPGPGEVRVAVAAAGLNRADCLQRKGVYPAPPGYPDAVPGLELAGTVEAVGEGVRAFAEGDRVMAIIGGGGMATHAVLHERELLPVPEGMPPDGNNGIDVETWATTCEVSWCLRAGRDDPSRLQAGARLCFFYTFF